MNNATYALAGKSIIISSQYDEVHELCAAYRIPQCEPDFVVCTTQDDIEYERASSVRQGTYTSCSDAVLETLAVYRRIAEWMPLHDTVLFHGSAIAIDGVCYLFGAKSGTGKSTHARLWREAFGSRVQMVNDDKPLLHVAEAGTIVYGTPWDGKYHLSSNVAVPLRAICLLGRGSHNHICRIAGQDGYLELLGQTYRPADPASLAKTLELVDSIVATVPLYRLSCNMELDAARVSYTAMSAVENEK